MSVVTVEEARGYLRLTSTSADSTLAIIRDSCEDWLARELGVAWTNGSKTERVDGGGDLLYLTQKPVTEITSIVDKIDDSTVDTDEYYVDTRGAARAIDQAEAWYAGQDRFEVTYKGGYTNANVPAGIKLLLLQLIARAWKNPDGRSSESSGVGAMIAWNKIADTDLQREINAYKLRRFA